MNTILKNPCLSCGHHLQGGDKNAECCLNCTLRVEYSRQIGEYPAEPTTQQSPMHHVEPKIIETRICKRGDDCVGDGEPMPLDEDHFNRRPDNPKKFDTTCKECRAKDQAERNRKSYYKKKAIGGKEPAKPAEKPKELSHNEVKLKIEFSASPELLRVAREIIEALGRFEAGVK